MEPATRTDTPSAPAIAGPSDYFALLKPRVMSLVIFTALVGMVAAGAAGGQSSHRGLAVGLASFHRGGRWRVGRAQHVVGRRHRFRVMARTAGRPIPRGAVPAPEAAGFGGILSALSVALLALASQTTSRPGLLAFTIFFYLVIYSMWLKRSTPQNIVIGGAAGALPPVVGWAAVSGTVRRSRPGSCLLIIFLWTPPHFWALALYREGDYARAGVPMMPNVKGEALNTPADFRLRNHPYAGCVSLPAFTSLAGPVYLFCSSALLGGAFLHSFPGAF